MNVEGQPENFHRQALQSPDGDAGSSAGGGTDVEDEDKQWRKQPLRIFGPN